MTFFNNLRMITKIALVLLVLIVISLGVSTMSYQSLSTQEETADITEHTYRVMGTLSAISMAMIDQETGIRGYIMSADEAYLEPEKVGLAAYTENMARIRQLLADNPAQQTRLDAFEAFVKTWRTTVAEPELALMKDPATRDEALKMAISGKGKESMDGMRASIQEMIEIEDALLRHRTTAANAAAAQARYGNIAGGGAIIVVAILALFTLDFGVVRQLRGLNQTMRTLADGETDFVVLGTDRKDEVGEMAAAVEVFRQAAIAKRRLEEEAEAARVQAEADRIRVTAEAEAAAEKRLREATSGLATGLKRLAAGDLAFQLNEPFAPDFEALRHDLNGAVEQLAETLRSVAQATNAIDNGSREISQSADDLSKRTEQQAASLEETAAALDQITANVTSSSKRAEEARTVAVQANASAVQSGKVVANAVDAMQKIEQSSNQVSNIIGVIDEIAFQTNLLALNAGVEAARAGEAGKGFAVVAQEVRELAQRSAQAAKEIKELIRKSSVEVQSGVTLVQETGEALRTIEGYIITVNQHMDAIAISAKEQSVGLGEVNTAVNQMDNVTQQNAAMVEETSAAGATLANESGRLRELISQFQLGGSSRQTAPVAIASNTHRPVGSPVRALTGKVANAFSGNTAAKEVWEDF